MSFSNKISTTIEPPKKQKLMEDMSRLSEELEIAKTEKESIEKDRLIAGGLSGEVEKQQQELEDTTKTLGETKKNLNSYELSIDNLKSKIDSLNDEIKKNEKIVELQDKTINSNGIEAERIKVEIIKNQAGLDTIIDLQKKEKVLFDLKMTNRYRELDAIAHVIGAKKEIINELDEKSKKNAQVLGDTNKELKDKKKELGDLVLKANNAKNEIKKTELTSKSIIDNANGYKDKTEKIVKQREEELSVREANISQKEAWLKEWKEQIQYTKRELEKFHGKKINIFADKK